jgi:hypothetical protein
MRARQEAAKPKRIEVRPSAFTGGLSFAGKKRIEDLPIPD